MSRIEYRKRRFRRDTLTIINRANQICEEYAAQGLSLTLRQCYYQFVSRGWMANRQSEYKRLGQIIGDARLAGLIDWEHLEDRTRNVRIPAAWRDQAHIISAVADSYAIDKWADQPNRVEVWVEKDALVGILDSVCPDEGVPHFSCRGYTSLTEVWGAAQRIRQHLVNGQNVIVIHLGDHDPSGLDMSRDIEDRLRMFVNRDRTLYLARDAAEAIRAAGGPEAFDLESWAAERVDTMGTFQVERVALNIDQINRYNPPPNPAKEDDSRFRRYVEQTGLNESWELDALDPTVLVQLIRDEIDAWRDDDLWEAMVEREASEREILRACSDRWADVQDFLNGDAA